MTDISKQITEAFANPEIQSLVLNMIADAEEHADWCDANNKTDHARYLRESYIPSLYDRVV